MVDHDFAATLQALINTNWSAGIIAKPTLTLARSVKKTRKKHTANTIYFFTHERFVPVNHWLTRDYTVVVPIMIVGTTLSNHDDMISGYEDATWEHLDDTSDRTFHNIETVWMPDIHTRPRNRFITEGETTLTVFAEDITT